MVREIPSSNNAILAGCVLKGLAGQFWIGVLLGAVWSPCVGPTLGAASLLAAQGEDLGGVALTMFAFGVGAALPLLGLGWLSRETMARWSGNLPSAGSGTILVILLLVILADSSYRARTNPSKLCSSAPSRLTIFPAEL